MDLSERIKLLRKQKGLTLAQVAQKTGIAQSTLSRIESGIRSGNLKTHLKICDALGVKPSELYAGLEMPAEKIAPIESRFSEEAESFTYNKNAYSIILAKAVSKKNMLPQILMLEPNGKTAVEEDPAGTEKFIYCLKGNIEVIVEDKHYFLKETDTLYFRSSLPHSIKNTGKEKAKCLSVTSPVTL